MVFYKKGENNDIGSLVSHVKEKNDLNDLLFSKQDHFAKKRTIKQQ